MQVFKLNNAKTELLAEVEKQNCIKQKKCYLIKDNYCFTTKLGNEEPPSFKFLCCEI
jgi:hypothetical protein